MPSELVSLLKVRELEEAVQAFSGISTVELNYYWELKKGEERGFLDVVFNGSKWQIPQPVMKESKKVYYKLVEEATELRAYLMWLMYDFDADFKGYYLKGNKNEEMFGSLVEE